MFYFERYVITYRYVWSILILIESKMLYQMLYLYGLTRGRGQPGPHNGEVIYQTGTQIFLLYIHGRNLYLHTSCVTVVYGIIYRTAELLNLPQDRFQVESWLHHSSAYYLFHLQVESRKLQLINSVNSLRLIELSSDRFRQTWFARRYITDIVNFRIIYRRNFHVSALNSISHKVKVPTLKHIHSFDF